MDALFNHIFQPKIRYNDESSKVILLWNKAGITKLHAVKSANVADRPNHFVPLLPIPSGKRKLKKGTITLVANPNAVELPRPEQKKKKYGSGSGSLITSYFGQCNKSGIYILNNPFIYRYTSYVSNQNVYLHFHPNHRLQNGI